MDTNETTIYTAILITGLVIGTIFLYFIITIYRNHRKHFRLLSKQFVAEVDLLEKERTRIATDLHDELGPILAVTQIQLNSIESINESEIVHLEKANENIQRVTERLRGIARNLTPSILVQKGLEVALQDFIDQIGEMSRLSIHLTVSIRQQPEILQSLHLYRMIQELIHNTIKHSRASVATILLKERKRKIYLLYTDDGIGLPKEKPKFPGLGLESLNNRTEMLGGKMDCSSSERKGVEYFFEFPITKLYG